MQSVETITIY